MSLTVLVSNLWMMSLRSISDIVCPGVTRDRQDQGVHTQFATSFLLLGPSPVKPSLRPLAEDGSYKTVCYPTFCLDTTLPGTGFPEMQVLSPLIPHLHNTRMLLFQR